MTLPVVRALLRQQCDDAGLVAGTHPENRAALRLHRWGLKFTQQHPVGPYRLDIAFPAQKIAVEIDGWHHASPEGAAKDARRDADLRRRGWLVLRVNDGDDLDEQLVRVAQVVNALRVV